MNEKLPFGITEKWILSNRGSKNPVDPLKPYAWLVEKERTASGKLEDTATIFLTNRECPYKCLMCDLWKNTTDSTSIAGTIPDQIEWALNQMPSAKHLKLYNSGSFFDRKAIPVSDYQRIADIVSHFETVIVEAHARLIGNTCLDFKKLLKPELQVALGLETVHQDVLQKLNKQMSLENFSDAVSFLKQNEIQTRAFILLRPPFLSEEEGIYWAERSIDFAFNCGVECCIIIPVRAGNGAMDRLKDMNLFSPPNIISLEKVLEYGIGLKRGRVFADVWDIEIFSSCKNCLDERTKRLIYMNFFQTSSESINCSCNSKY
jgi:radical SAM enzyme (TIGR01210 family)